MLCTMPCARTRGTIPRSCGRGPRPSSCPCLKSPHRSNSTRILSSSICPVPAPSKRSYSGSPPCCAPSQSWPTTRRDVLAVPRRDRLQAHSFVHATPRYPQQGVAPDSRHAPTGEVRVFAAANPSSPPQRCPETARTALQSPSRLLIRAKIHSHRCSTTVYEISRLEAVVQSTLPALGMLLASDHPCYSWLLCP